MRVLDLFSGIGGMSLGLERAGMRTVAFCEIEPYCRRVLAKHWPNVPCYGDIRELDGGTVECDVVSGGFPCQPFSVAGEQRGTEDDRHLWPEMLRVIAQARPAWVIGENVPGIIRMELDNVLSDLEGIGYTTRTFVIPACAVDAPHRRDRVWVVAHADSNGTVVQGRDGDSDDEERDAAEEIQEWTDIEHRPFLHGQEDVADSECSGQQGSREHSQWGSSTQSGEGETTDVESGCVGRIWGAEPAIRRVSDGIPSRMDRLRALGNAVVPQVVELIGRAIMRAQ